MIRLDKQSRRWQKQPHRYTVVLFGFVILFSIIIRVTYLVQLTNLPYEGQKVQGADSQYYLNWASQLQSGDQPIEGPFFMSPLYPYFLYGIFALCGHDLSIVRLIQCSIGLATIFLVFLVGKHIVNHEVGLIAAILHSLYAVIIFYEGMLLMATLLLFMNTLFLYLLVRFHEKSEILGTFLPGFILGLTAIGRGNVLLFIPFVFLFYYVTNRSHLKKVFIKILVFCSAILVALSPLIIRNITQDIAPTAITSNFGLNFYIGNNSESEGTYRQPDELTFIPGKLNEDIQGKHYAEQQLGRQLTSIEVSDYWLKQGLQYWKQKPLNAIRLFLKKIWLFWNHFEISQIEDFYFYRAEYAPVLYYAILSFGFVLPFFIIGIFYGFREKILVFIIVLIVVFCFSISIFFITSRYRVPILSYIVLIAAYGLYHSWQAVRQRNLKHISIIFCVILSSFILFRHQPFRSSSMFAHQFNQLGALYYNQSDFSSAQIFFLKAIEFDPYVSIAYRNLGDTYQKENRFTDAILAYTKAIQLSPIDAVSYSNIGHLYQLQNDIKLAERYYDKALELDPSFSMVYTNLALIKEEQGKLSESLKLYQRAIETDKHNHRAYNNLGKVLYRLEMKEEAIQFYLRAHQEEPSEIRYSLNLAIVLGEMSQPAKALSLLLSILPQIKNDEQLEQKCVKHIMLNYIQNGDLDKAESVGTQFLKRHPKNATISELLQSLSTYQS